MRARLFLAAWLAVLLGLLAAGPLTGAARATEGGEVVLWTWLTGEQEVPGPGDPRGTGEAVVRLNAEEGWLCYELSVWDLTAAPTAAHIHLAPAGFAGPVLVRLDVPAGASGWVAGCATVADIPGATDPSNVAGVAAALAAAPELFYVNVHTAEFPAGAVRGQLQYVSGD